MSNLDQVLAEIGWPKQLREAFLVADTPEAVSISSTEPPEPKPRVVDLTEYIVRVQ